MNTTSHTPKTGVAVMKESEFALAKSIERWAEVRGSNPVSLLEIWRDGGSVADQKRLSEWWQDVLQFMKRIDIDEYIRAKHVAGRYGTCHYFDISSGERLAIYKHLAKWSTHLTNRNS